VLIRGSRSTNLLEWDEPLALQNTVERICFQVLDNVGGTRWPANLDAVDFGRGARPKCTRKQNKLQQRIFNYLKAPGTTLNH
jgi:hypothetical protein